MIALEQFLPDVLDDLKHAPPIVAERHLVRAARDFCRRTRIWRASITVPLIPPHQEEFTLTPASIHAQVDGVYRAYLDGVEMAILNELQLDRRGQDFTSSPYQMTNWRDRKGSGLCALHQAERNKVKLIPMLSEAVEASLEIIAYQIPTPSAKELPDVLFDSHVECLAYGTKARMMLLQDQPWADLTRAEYYQRKYEEGVAKEIKYQTSKNSNRPLRARFVPFA